MKHQATALLKRSEILFAGFWLGFFLAFTRNPRFDQIDFWIGSVLSVFVAGVFWRRWMDRPLCSTSRLYGFSLLWGTSQFALFFLSSLAFVLFAQGSPAANFPTGADLVVICHLAGNGILYSILTSVVAAMATHGLRSIFQTRSQEGCIQGTNILVQHNLLDHVTIHADGTCLFRQRTRVQTNQTIELSLPGSSRPIATTITIRKRILWCRSEVRLIADGSIVSQGILDWFGGITLLDVCLANLFWFLSIVSFDSLLSNPRGHGPEMPLPLLCGLILARSVAPFALAAVAAHLAQSWRESRPREG